MNKLLFVLLLFVVSLTGAITPFVLSLRPVSDPPGLNFDNAIYDCGVSPQNSKLNKVVVLRNNTMASLQIVEFRQSCHCALVSKTFLGKEIAPNEKLEVPVVFSTGEASGVLESRLVAGVRSIDVDTNGKTIFASCTIRTYVRPDFTLSAKLIDFGTIPPRASVVTKELIFESLLPKPVVVKSVKCSSQFFNVTLSKITEEQCKISVHFDPSVHNQIKKGSFVGMLEITTNCPSSPVGKVQVKAEIAFPLRATPSSLVFVAGQDTTLPLVIRSRDGTDFSITDTKCCDDDGMIAVNLHQKDIGSEQQLLIRLQGTLSKRKKQLLRIECKFSDGKTSFLDVPVFFLSFTGDDL